MLYRQKKMMPNAMSEIGVENGASIVELLSYFVNNAYQTPPTPTNETDFTIK